MNPARSNLRRLLGSILFFVCCAVATGSVLAAGDLPKDIAARLAANWIAGAKQIRTPEHVIYYHGTATGSMAPDGKHWTGEVEGEVLVLTSTTATACAKFRLSPTGGISVQGPAQTKLDVGVPPWNKLLEPHQ